MWQEGKIGASTTCWPRAKRPMQFLSWLFGGGSGSPKEPEKSEDVAPAVSKAATQPIKGSTTGTIERYDDEEDRVSLLLASLLGLIVHVRRIMRRTGPNGAANVQNTCNDDTFWRLLTENHSVTRAGTIRKLPVATRSCEARELAWRISIMPRYEHYAQSSRSSVPLATLLPCI